MSQRLAEKILASQEEPPPGVNNNNNNNNKNVRAILRHFYLGALENWDRLSTSIMT